ncbi:MULTISPECIES: heavy-metal-associated domain-containing protein [unclassified Rhodococcus (in: high G+C Gram-positive bacteria)]|uniref:heavy-metal-associated domain-containing protein n=1 Tax=unclassified Rhodococcus (in: high G+C Gram-positive bacteria) TaxID=192944 RepID=UPI001B34B9D1|nr:MULTISPECIES: heavy-metal-associated domain-containing protein [unclassified Rhodococcus (in: high G+C Gram-positive bacteria)]
MNPTATSDLTLTDLSPNNGCGCGCGSSHPSTATKIPSSPTDQQFAVTGLTCGHCARAVTTEVEAIEGVRHVTVVLVAGGVSTVSIDSASLLSRSQVAAALDEAGDYHLTSD